MKNDEIYEEREWQKYEIEMENEELRKFELRGYREKRDLQEIMDREREKEKDGGQK